MLFTSKTKSDVIMKGQRIQRFLRENINRAKTRHVRINSKHVRAYVLRNLIPGSAHLLSRDMLLLYLNVIVYLKEIPCLNKVTLPYLTLHTEFEDRSVRLRTEFFPQRFMAQALRAWAINPGGKNKVP